MITNVSDLIDFPVNLDNIRFISFMEDDPNKITFIRLLKSMLDEDYHAACVRCCIEEGSEAYEFIASIWEKIKPVSVTEIQRSTKNADKKALYFRFLRVAEMFKAEGAEMLDRKVIITKNKTWDEGNHEEINDLENVYELWRINAEKLYENMEGYIFSVRCWCPSTGREFFIVVDNTAKFCQKGHYDAAEAIASTALCPISNPKALYRQGDVLFFEHSDDPKNPSYVLDEPVRLTAKEYFSLLVSQT